jgi:hypothetical protein
VDRWDRERLHRREGHQSLVIRAPRVSPGQMTSDDKDLDVKEGDESLLRNRKIATDQLLPPPPPIRIGGGQLGISALQLNQMRVFVALESSRRYRRLRGCGTVLG